MIIKPGFLPKLNETSKAVAIFSTDQEVLRDKDINKAFSYINSLEKALDATGLTIKYRNFATSRIALLSCTAIVINKDGHYEWAFGPSEQIRKVYPNLTLSQFEPEKLEAVGLLVSLGNTE